MPDECAAPRAGKQDFRGMAAGAQAALRIRHAWPLTNTVPVASLPKTNTCKASSKRAGRSERARVVLTREAGKNAKLLAMLAARGVPAMELPLVETAPGPDREALPGALRSGGFDWAVITSPEAAAVFLEGWRSAERPQASPNKA